jgi:hypothetical protein
LEKEIIELKEKLKRSEDLRLEEKMNWEFKICEINDDYEDKMKAMRLDDKMKIKEMRLKIKKISKYAISQEAWYHYLVGSVVTLFAIMIAFVVGFKFIS